MSNRDNAISFNIYKPHNSWAPTVRAGYCAWSVPDGGRSVSLHQCSFKVVETVEGHGLCRRHAAEMKRIVARFAAPVDAAGDKPLDGSGVKGA